MSSSIRNIMHNYAIIILYIYVPYVSLESPVLRHRYNVKEIPKLKYNIYVYINGVLQYILFLCIYIL